MHISSPSGRLESIDNRHRAKLPENPSNITLSGQKGLLINGCTKPLRGSFLAGILYPFISFNALSSP
jgi:hypothetical protein